MVKATMPSILNTVRNTFMRLYGTVEEVVTMFLVYKICVHILPPSPIIMHLLNRYCQYKAYKNDKSNFIFKRMLFAKFTQAHAAFGRGICHLL